MRPITFSLVIIVLCLSNCTTALTTTSGTTPPLFVVKNTVSFSEKDLSFQTVNGFTAVSLQNCTELHDPGKPQLPVRHLRVALPRDMIVTGVQIIDEQRVTIAGAYTVYPAQPPLPLDTIDENRFVAPDPQAYASMQPYPPSPVSFIDQCDLAGQVMADISIYPVSYVPAEGTLTFLSSVTFSLTGTGGYVCKDFLPHAMSENQRTTYMQMIKEMVVNPATVNLQESQGPQPLGVTPGNYPYVIITKEAWASAFQQLADWKTQKGVPAKIVNTSWIYNNGGYSGSNVEKIRAFVQDAYNTWGTTYVLLGGDIDTVPCKNTTFPSVDSNPVPNDAYYADFDGDYVCEVNVGRASVNGTGNGTGRIGNFINKVLTYETNPPLTNYAKDAGIFGFDLDNSTHAEQCKKNINSTYIPAGWTVTTVYDSQSGNHRTNVLTALNSGQNIVNHADHCNSNCMGTGYIHHNWLIYDSDMDALTNGNKQTVLYSMGCDPAAYDVPICIAEHFVRNKNGGGIAFIGNSRYGWYYYGDYTDLSMGFDAHFFKALFQENLTNLGAAFSAHKNEGYQDYPGEPYYQYIFTELTLLGDPEIPIWTQNPASLIVTHPSLLPLGTSPFYVAVSSGGSPVNQAYVCLWKGTEIYQRGYTNATGNITFNVSASIAGIMKITVTKHNFLPNVSTALVTGEDLPPTTPSTPTPANTSTMISINPSLSWISSDPNQGDIVTYDVYFGNASNPPRVADNQSGATYHPGSLAYATTYSWRIVAWDNHGASAAGPSWSFTTKANTPPVYGSPTPANGSAGTPLHFTWNIPISDPDADPFNWTIQCSNGQHNSGTGASNGTKSLVLTGLAYTTSYKVWVNTTDPGGSGLYTRRWYLFTTKVSLPPIYGSPTAANGSSNASLGFTWSIPINDPEGDLLSWSIQCSDGQQKNRTGETNGTKSLPLSGLTYSTSYKVWVNATDPTGSGLYTRKWYIFKTKANLPPILGTPTPTNGSTNLSLGFDWSIPINDTEGDPFYWTIQCSNTQHNSEIEAANGTKTLALFNLSNATTYIVWVNATDPTGSKLNTTAWYNFTTQVTPVNAPPQLSNPFPANGSTNIAVTTSTLSIIIQDPEGDHINWTITTSPNIGSNAGTLEGNGTKTVSVSGLSSATKYRWTVQTYDGHHWTNQTFSFTTASSGGGGTPSPPPVINYPPIANLSAGQPSQGEVNTTIFFNGSKSSDPDGTITKWFWTFGDQTNSSGEVVEHRYTQAGVYTVILTVTDNQGATGTATATCMITQPNRPPTPPYITGPTQGSQDTCYNYTVVSTDADNDTLRYFVRWGDETSYENVSSFLPRDIPFTCNHRWTTPGSYTITAFASDNKTNSEPAYLTVLIDIKYTGGLGYLIDEHGGGVFDEFYSNSTMNETRVQRQVNGTYLIDSNGDGTWEYWYNTTTGAFLAYRTATGAEAPGFEVALFVSLALVVSLVVCTAVLLLLLRRKNKK